MPLRSSIGKPSTDQPKPMFQLSGLHCKSKLPRGPWLLTGVSCASELEIFSCRKALRLFGMGTRNLNYGVLKGREFRVGKVM